MKKAGLKTRVLTGDKSLLVDVLGALVSEAVVLQVVEERERCARLCEVYGRNDIARAIRQDSVRIKHRYYGKKRKPASGEMCHKAQGLAIPA